MKQIILTLFTIVFSIGLFAQNESDKDLKSGIVTYKKTVKLDIQIDGDAGDFASMLPKERKSKKLLYFNENTSLYERLKEQDIEEITHNHEGGMIIKIQESDDKIFTNIKEKKYFEQREFMSRMFLIESDVDSKGWKMTGNQKVILDYNCQEAIKEKDSIKIIAWFTSEIPISTGPGHTAGLPGFVLELNVSEGQEIVTAISIENKEIDKTVLAKPNKGKKVTQEEFKTIVDEKMKEMGIENEGGSHKMIIKIKHD